jgi:hypothetical protein
MDRHYAIIEIDAGLTVTELKPGMTAEEAAQSEGGLVADPGPYKSYDDAYDAAFALPDEEDDEDV